MNKIKIFEGDDPKKLQDKVNRWTAKMRKEHTSGFRIGGISLTSFPCMGSGCYTLAVTYKA